MDDHDEDRWQPCDVVGCEESGAPIAFADESGVTAAHLCKKHSWLLFVAFYEGAIGAESEPDWEYYAEGLRKFLAEERAT